jgi:hypothetical protein
MKNKLKIKCIGEFSRGFVGNGGCVGNEVTAAQAKIFKSARDKVAEGRAQIAYMNDYYTTDYGGFLHRKMWIYVPVISTNSKDFYKKIGKIDDLIEILTNLKKAIEE